MLAASVSKFAAMMVTYPFQVMRTRLQVSGKTGKKKKERKKLYISTDISFHHLYIYILLIFDRIPIMFPARRGLTFEVFVMHLLSLGSTWLEIFHSKEIEQYTNKKKTIPPSNRFIRFTNYTSPSWFRLYIFSFIFIYIYIYIFSSLGPKFFTEKKGIAECIADSYVGIKFYFFLWKKKKMVFLT